MSRRMFDGFKVINRADGRVELQCPHGVGHTSKALTLKRGVVAWDDWMGIHGCDLCCGTPAWKKAERVRVGLP